MGQSRTVLDHERTLPGYELGFVHGDHRAALDDLRRRVGFMARVDDLFDLDRIGGIHLVDDQEVRHQEIGLARVVGELVTRSMRIDERDVEIGAIKGCVVVAAVPQDDVGLLLGLTNDLLVVDAGKDYKPIVYVRFVLLTLFDRALVAIEILVGLEALAGLFGEITVGHGVADRDHLLPHLLEDARDIPCGLRFPDTGADGGDRDQRFAGFDHRPCGRVDTEVRPPADHPAPLAHHVVVGNVGVAEPHLIDVVLLDHIFEIRLRKDRNTAGIERPGELRGIRPALDVRDLGGSEGHHLVVLVVAIQTVEVMKIAPSRTHDDDLGPCHDSASMTAHR